MALKIYGNETIYLSGGVPLPAGTEIYGYIDISTRYEKEVLEQKPVIIVDFRTWLNRDACYAGKPNIHVLNSDLSNLQAVYEIPIDTFVDNIGKTAVDKVIYWINDEVRKLIKFVNANWNIDIIDINTN